MTTTINYIVAAVDLDDTLLRSDGTISPYTLEVLQRWQGSGRRLVIATGRPQRTIHPALPAVLHDLPVICYNGAEIHIDGQRVHEILIPSDAVRLIVEQLLLTAPDCTVGLEVAGELYLNRAMDRPTPYQVADLLEIAARPAAKVLIFGEQLTALAPLLEALPATARALHSARYRHFVQILAAGANKAAALAVLMAQWGVPLRQVVAFGDDTNDIELLLECGLGVAMDNAAEEVKAVADEVTATNDDDGVALVLARLLEPVAL
jgi:5-amino-6-(5-phospho-D-ribitylamino)uracil phosphatase